MDWEEKTLGELITINRKNISKNNHLVDINYYDISSIGTGFKGESKYYKFEDIPSRAKRIIHNNDIIISTVRPINRSFYYCENTKYNDVVSTGFAVLSANKECIDSRFLYYIISSHSFTNYLVSNEQGATYPTITPDIIKKAKIKLPPLKTQIKIASILSNYDQLIENNNQRIKLLESMAEEIYKEWFVRLRFPDYEKVESVDGLPFGWERKKLDDICEITSSKRIFLSDYTSEGIPFYRGKEITIKSKNEMIGTELFIAEDKFKEIRKKFGSPVVNDILITAVGTLGSIYLVKKSDGDFYFKDGNLIWLKNFKNNFYLYLYSFFKSKDFQYFIEGFSIGSSQKALTIDSLKKSSFLYPNPKLVKQFNTFVNPLYEEIQILQQKNKTLKETRDLLLPRLINGKLT